MHTLDTIRNRPAKQLLWVCFGMGVDSWAILIQLKRLGVRPDVITFADTGDEKKATYDFIPVAQKALADWDFPPVTVVKKASKKYNTLGENCIRNHTLPSLSYGLKACSMKWKKDVQEGYAKKLPEARACWEAGHQIIKMIGYDAGPKDMRRSSIREDKFYTYSYPLREIFGWDRERCLAEIAAEGLPGWNADNERDGADLYWVASGGVPVKSACTFCPANKPWELRRLARTEPENWDYVVRLEHRAEPWLTTVKGLGRTWNFREAGIEMGLPIPNLPRRHPLVVADNSVTFVKSDGKNFLPNYAGWEGRKAAFKAKGVDVRLFPVPKKAVSLAVVATDDGMCDAEPQD